MSDFPERIYRLAKSYMESTRTRIDAIDQAALAELQQALPYGDPANPGSYTPLSDDPMQRAAAKISAARAAAAYTAPQSGPTASPVGFTPLEQAAESSTPAPQSAAVSTNVPSDPLTTAFRVIGVPAGSDKGTVDDAVRKLRERCDPSKFPDGSSEKQEAQQILTHIDEAYALIQHSLNVEASRFDKLEL